MLHYTYLLTVLPSMDLNIEAFTRTLWYLHDAVICHVTAFTGPRGVLPPGDLHTQDGDAARGQTDRLMRTGLAFPILGPAASGIAYYKCF